MNASVQAGASSLSLFYDNVVLYNHCLWSNDASSIATIDRSSLRRILVIDRQFLNAAFAQEAIDQIYRTQQLHPFLLFGFVIGCRIICHFLFECSGAGHHFANYEYPKSGLAHQMGQGTLWQPRYDLRIPQNKLKVLDYIDQKSSQSGLCATTKRLSVVFSEW